MQARHIATLLALIFALSACAHQPAPPASDLPGFFSGLWHGFTALFSLIGSLFWDVRVYAFPNSGFWYDLGFLFGFSLWGSFIAGGSRRRAGTQSIVESMEET